MKTHRTWEDPSAEAQDRAAGWWQPQWPGLIACRGWGWGSSSQSSPERNGETGNPKGSFPMLWIRSVIRDRLAVHGEEQTADVMITTHKSSGLLSKFFLLIISCPPKQALNCEYHISFTKIKINQWEAVFIKYIFCLTEVPLFAACLLPPSPAIEKEKKKSSSHPFLWECSHLFRSVL